MLRWVSESYVWGKTFWKPGHSSKLCIDKSRHKFRGGVPQQETIQLLNKTCHFSHNWEVWKVELKSDTKTLWKQSLSSPMLIHVSNAGERSGASWASQKAKRAAQDSSKGSRQDSSIDCWAFERKCICACFLRKQSPDSKFCKFDSRKSGQFDGRSCASRILGKAQDVDFWIASKAWTHKFSIGGAHPERQGPGLSSSCHNHTSKSWL